VIKPGQESRGLNFIIIALTATRETILSCLVQGKIQILFPLLIQFSLDIKKEKHKVKVISTEGISQNQTQQHNKQGCKISRYQALE
jgi:hypothetical protein